MKVIWSAEAENTYGQIIDNLNIRWTDKEILNFISQTEHTLLLIKSNPYMFKALELNKDIRKGYINKLVSMFYKVDMQKQIIWIVDLWNNKQNPDNITTNILDNSKQ